MAEHVLTIYHQNEEEVEYLLDGTPIGSANHDQHGWAGMELADQLVANFAEAFNITIINTYDGEEE